MRFRFSPRLQLVLAAVLFSTGGAAIKATALNGWLVASFRSGIAALVLLLVVPGARRHWGWRPLLVGVVSGITFLLFVTANKLTTAANTIFLQSAAPLYMVLLSPLLLRERARRQDLLLMAVVGLGLSLFFVGTDAPVATAPDPVRGNILAALSGVSWALTVMGLRWMGSREGDHGVVAVVIGNLVAFGVGLWQGWPVPALRLADAGVLLYLGVFQIGLAYLLVTSALREVPAIEAAILLLIEPACSPFWAWLVHGERPGLWASIGGALILGATTAQSVLAARRPGGGRAMEVIE
ncbi:MAG: EamA family transporter [Gemmatimonadales bacterium]|jgi:drug/metabolite transporter (DMT)-like permease|nr:EamA family transporter [Gemmatimonadales bacterium]